MSAVNKVDVVIDGAIITLMSGEQEEYMQKLARYIDKKLAEIKSTKTNASFNERTRTLLISVNIADDYFKTYEQLKQLQHEHERYVTEMGRMQEENFLLTEKIHELQDDLNQSRAELDAYIENFDKPAEEDEAEKVVKINQRTGNGYR